MPDDMVDAHICGVNDALAAGWHVIERGGAALDAVEEAVVIMEDDETFDAGRGSFLNRNGKVQLDALIMDGAARREKSFERELPRLFCRRRRRKIRRRTWHRAVRQQGLGHSPRSRAPASIS